MKSLEQRSSGTSTGTTAEHLPPNWQDRVVVAKNGVPTRETWRLLTAQQRAEGGNAKWNPLNCTLWIQNYTELPNYNDIPVRNYRYPDVGIAAIILTLSNHNSYGKLTYGKMVDQFQHASDGRSAESMLTAAWDNYIMWASGSYTGGDAYPRLIQSLLAEIS